MKVSVLIAEEYRGQQVQGYMGRICGVMSGRQMVLLSSEAPRGRERLGPFDVVVLRCSTNLCEMRRVVRTSMTAAECKEEEGIAKLLMSSYGVENVPLEVEYMKCWHQECRHLIDKLKTWYRFGTKRGWLAGRSREVSSQKEVEGDMSLTSRSQTRMKSAACCKLIGLLYSHTCS